MYSITKKLAIVIPAYKKQYLDKALESLASQTNKDFIVYIGDDASPYDLASIVAKYQNSLDIVYKKFESNLGGRDLVAQWERCVSMTKDEPWIWLFSDDDMLDDGCVQCFYNHIKINTEDDFLHFNVNVINEEGAIIEKTSFPESLDAYTFALFKLKGKLKSYVVEYVFKRDLYSAIGGFRKYDLAWNADDATWIEMARRNHIKTINGSCVNWRKSSVNISPNNKDIAVVRRKIEANLEYVKYLNQSFNGFVQNVKLTIAIITWFSVGLLKCKKVISTKDTLKYLMRCAIVLHKPFIYPFAVVYLGVKNKLMGDTLV